ncbi:Uncharacterised protein [Mycolicibacterium vanbaalenii]|uniref:Uncharacterized protein n=1 Tax=Mycolicibacterium vanbaalenii TaxID=110539 RepID=A0A5S9R3F4_MYCVN|nr:hypothetical protein [Mycolicibacterium vanbaalenii]CAA0127414.1 Uncharacterised protein [Mycolicibacterium vanbaalenii]
MGDPAIYGTGEFEPILATIGDISVSQHWVITPTGPHPIRGSVWTVTDMSQWQEGISAVGVVLCILFIWVCLLGLLFLLMKDRKLTGYIQVTVQGKGFHHQTLVPVRGPDTFAQVHQSVNYARSLSALG